MGRFKHLVDTNAGMEGFRAKYHILQGVALQYCPPDQIDFDRREGEVVILMIAFIEGGMTLPMGRVTRDHLINHRSTLFFSFPWSMGSSPSTSCFSIIFVFHSFPIVITLYWTGFFSLDVFADKRHVAPRHSLINVPGLNKVLKSEIWDLREWWQTVISRPSDLGLCAPLGRIPRSRQRDKSR